MDDSKHDKDELSLPTVEVLPGEPSEQADGAASNVNFWGHEKRGFSPMGMAAILKAAKVDKVTYWHRGKTPYTYGVLLFQPRVNQKIVEDVISKIESVYPVHGGMKRLGVIVFEKGTMRGLHAIGDLTDLASFWTDLSIGVCSVTSVDVYKDSVCWTIMNTGDYFIPYIDIDEVGTQCDFPVLWSGRVKVCLDLVQGLLKQWNPDPVYQIYFNVRQSDKFPGLYKYSFHVHFYKCLVANINAFKEALKKISGMPFKREWSKTGPTSYSVKEDKRSFIFDSAVYGGRKQLFRGPFCGKNGNPSACMVPIDVVPDEDGTPSVKTHGEDDVDARNEYILMARISSPVPRDPHSGFVVCDLGPQEDRNQYPLVHVPSDDLFTASNTIRQQTKATAAYEFWRPLLYSEVIPAWQMRRDADSRLVGGSGWTIPLKNVSISKDVVHPHKPHVRILQVAGDTYCETDSNHYHSQNQHTINICVDIQQCVIWQNCFACGRGGVKYHFLHSKNAIVIKTADESRLTHESFYHPVHNVYNFLLDYYSDLFCHHQPTDTLYVLDTDTLVWRTGTTANGVVGKLYDAACSKFANYIQERQTAILDNTLSHYIRSNPHSPPDEIEKKRQELMKDGRKFIAKFSTLGQLSASARGKLVDDLRSYPVRMKVDDMNCFSHYVPMRNLQAYDVFTGETHEFKSRYLFTGIVNAELATDSNDIDAIEKWFMEIATGDADKARYLKIISGYMMTFLMHDRKFFVLKGTGKNGKGIHKQFLVSILSGARGTDARWKALNQTFWEKKANSNSGAEAPSPEAHGMINKTLFYTDDIERVAIDAGKVKRVVAGEVMSGRGLFMKPVVIEPKGKVLWTTNHTIDLPGNDNAAWERYSQIDYNTKYVDDPQCVDPAHYKFLQNDVAVQELLQKTDAFFTVSMFELTRYYKSLKFNPATGQPLTLTTFPVPPAVVAAKADARSQQLPLANFFRVHASQTAEPLYFAEIGTMFSAYINFLDNENERRVRNETTLTSFVRQLATSLEIRCSATHVIGWKLSSEIARKLQKRDDFHGQGEGVRISADADVR